LSLTWSEGHLVGRAYLQIAERGDLGQPEAPGDGRHGGTGDARRKINLGFHEFGHAAGALELSGLEPVTAGRPKEGHLSLRCNP
jgi:hypothetical protein